VTITDAAGQTTTNTYNARGQILSSTDPLGETTTFAYDTNSYLLSITGALQNASDVTSFAYDSYGRVHTTTDTEGYTLTYTYDVMDRVTNIAYPDGTTEQFVYSNLDLVASADRLGRWTTHIYNADRQLTQTQDPLGRITQYNYCDCGALESVIDPAGNPTWWDHDVQSRVTAKHYADGSTLQYTYENTTSRLHSRLDEKGQQTLYQYYNDDNIQSVSYPNAIVATPSVSYSYDTNYNRIVTMQDGIGTTAYLYSPITSIPTLGAGRLASISGPLPNSVVTYQYDALERITNRAINGIAETAAFDILGRPTTITNALGTFQYGYVDATMRLASEGYPNGQTNLYTYYNNIGDERLQQIQNLYPNGSLLSAFGYAHNSVGEIIAWTNEWDTQSNRVWFPGYDAADQLTNVVVSGGIGPVTDYDYAYDLAENRTVAGTNGVQTQYYYTALNQLAGSSATLPNITYTWNAENRLASINQESNQTLFSYDGLGRRVQIEELTNGVIQNDNYYLWCGSEVCEVLDVTGTNVLRELFSQGESLPDATNYYYTRDHLGSIREVLDSDGNLQARNDYDPFGQQTASIENFQPTFGFAGDLVHEPSGLYLTWFRVLDSLSGRWLSRDPFGERTSKNLYTYVSNCPICFVDPLGLWEFVVATPWIGFSFGYNCKTGQDSFSLSEGPGLGFAYLPNSQPTGGLTGSGFAYIGPFGRWFSENPASWDSKTGGFGFGGSFGAGWTWTWAPGKVNYPLDIPGSNPTQISGYGDYDTFSDNPVEGQ
jgi:RHS repeat-associated protein